MNKVLVRISHNLKFKEFTCYDLNKEAGTCIVHCEFELSSHGWRFIDVASGCPFGKKFETLRQAREFRVSDQYRIYSAKLLEVRVKSDYYDKLVAERNREIERRKTK